MQKAGGAGIQGIKLGPDLITNGDFATDLTGWANAGVGSTWVFDAGTAQLTSGAGQIGILTQDISASVGDRYRVTVGTVSFTTGTTLDLYIGGSSNILATFTGGAVSVDVTVQAGDTDGLIKFSSRFNQVIDINIDDIACYKIL